MTALFTELCSSSFPKPMCKGSAVQWPFPIGSLGFPYDFVVSLCCSFNIGLSLALKSDMGKYFVRSEDDVRHCSPDSDLMAVSF